jgi:hypothetical protein
LDFAMTSPLEVPLGGLVSELVAIETGWNAGYFDGRPGRNGSALAIVVFEC